LMIALPGPIPCDGTSHERTVMIYADPTAPAGPISFGLHGHVGPIQCQTQVTVNVLSIMASLDADPTAIPATTAWLEMPPGISQSIITVNWVPPNCEGILEIVQIDPIQGYTPPDGGTLTRLDVNTWRYDAFEEPIDEACPGLVKVWIAAKQGDEELDRVSILVKPVHVQWTQGPSANLWADYQYISWKYAGVLATTGGAFNDALQPVTISSNPSVNCAGTVGYACTNYFTDTGTYGVTFGTSTFTGSENQAASIIGHELLHTAVGLTAGECPAYQWESDHSQQTGIWFCDTDYLESVLQQLANPDICP